MMSRWTRSRALWRGDALVAAPPATLAIETTTRCNLRCLGCLRNWDEISAQEMTDEVFSAAISWPDVESVLLYGLGEPLLDAKIFERIALAKRCGLHVQISTNGVLLDAPTRKKLLASGVDGVIFSLDAADAETYRRVRGSDDFAIVEENMRAFARLAFEHGKPRCTAQMVRLPENRTQQDAFVRKFGSTPGLHIRIKADETLARRREGVGRKHDRPCPVLFAGPLFVRADGTVYPCCHMMNTEPIGRLPDDDLKTIWNGPRMQELRRLHGTGRIRQVAVCNLCTLPIPPRTLSLLGLLLPQPVFRRLLPLAERLLRGRL